jgi:hypothetical protein
MLQIRGRGRVVARRPASFERRRRAKPVPGGGCGRIWYPGRRDRLAARGDRGDGRGGCALSRCCRSARDPAASARRLGSPPRQCEPALRGGQRPARGRARRREARPRGCGDRRRALGLCAGSRASRPAAAAAWLEAVPRSARLASLRALLDREPARSRRAPARAPACREACSSLSARPEPKPRVVRMRRTERGPRSQGATGRSPGRKAGSREARPASACGDPALEGGGRTGGAGVTHGTT